MPIEDAATDSALPHSLNTSLISLSFIILAALPWSLTLGFLGVWMLDHRHEGLLGSWAIATSGGIAALCGGQLVFLFCIVDRVYPQANRVMTRTIEGGLGAIFLGTTLVLAVVSLGGFNG